MSDYKEIHGQTVQVVSSNPSNTFSGQIWYNNTTKKITILGYSSTGSWASGGTMNNGQANGSSAGTLTAGLAFGGGMSTTTESYDGTSWTNLASAHNNPGAQNTGGVGTQTSALLVAGGGWPNGTNAVYEYDGSSWTSGGNLGTAGYYIGAHGTQTAALASGGRSNMAPAEFFGRNTKCEEYDGSSWTAAGALSNGRFIHGAAGTQTAGLAFAGNDDNYTAINSTEHYDGSSWTAGGNYGEVKVNHAGFGTQTAAVGAGGGPSINSATYTYDGSTWSADTSMPSGRSNISGSGTSSAGFVIGGNSNPAAVDNDEWSGAGEAVVTLDAS